MERIRSVQIVVDVAIETSKRTVKARVARRDDDEDAAAFLDRAKRELAELFAQWA